MLTPCYPLNHHETMVHDVMLTFKVRVSAYCFRSLLSFVLAAFLLHLVSASLLLPPLRRSASSRYLFRPSSKTSHARLRDGPLDYPAVADHRSNSLDISKRTFGRGGLALGLGGGEGGTIARSGSGKVAFRGTVAGAGVRRSRVSPVAKASAAVLAPQPARCRLGRRGIGVIGGPGSAGSAGNAGAKDSGATRRSV